MARSMQRYRYERYSGPISLDRYRGRKRSILPHRRSISLLRSMEGIVMVNVYKAYLGALLDHRRLAKVYKRHGMPNLSRYHWARSFEYIEKLRLVGAQAPNSHSH